MKAILSALRRFLFGRPRVYVAMPIDCVCRVEGNVVTLDSVRRMVISMDGSLPREPNRLHPEWEPSHREVL